MHRVKTIKIVIADDHEYFRYGFRKIIENHNPEDFEFVAEATNGIELLEKVKQHRPEIVITDIKMPEMDGIQACRIIRGLYPKTGIIALSIFDEENYILDMLNAGANGYLVKTTDKEEVREAVLTVNEGLSFYCSTISEKLFGIAKNSNFNKKRSAKVRFSLQEIKVIRLICKQLSTKEIAEVLNLGTRAIEDYRHNIQEKISARNVVGIVVYAVMNEIVKLSEL